MTSPHPADHHGREQVALCMHLRQDLLKNADGVLNIKPWSAFPPHPPLSAPPHHSALLGPLLCGQSCHSAPSLVWTNLHTLEHLGLDQNKARSLSAPGGVSQQSITCGCIMANSQCCYLSTQCFNKRRLRVVKYRRSVEAARRQWRLELPSLKASISSNSTSSLS